MDILFQGRKLEKTCHDQSLRVRTYGLVRAKLLERRLKEFRIVENLEELRLLPQVRCHELKGNRQGTLSVDLDHPYRLIFESANNPVPRKFDRGLDWTQVTAIRILAVENYHD